MEAIQMLCTCLDLYSGGVYSWRNNPPVPLTLLYRVQCTGRNDNASHSSNACNARVYLPGPACQGCVMYLHVCLITLLLIYLVYYYYTISFMFRF